MKNVTLVTQIVKRFSRHLIKVMKVIALNFLIYSVLCGIFDLYVYKLELIHEYLPTDITQIAVVTTFAFF